MKFIQYTNDAYLKDETQGYVKVIRDELKDNISIMDLHIFFDMNKQNEL